MSREYDDDRPRKRRLADDDDQPRRRKGPFEFVGGAGSYFVAYLLAYLLTVFTLFIGSPWAACMLIRWSVENTIVEGRRLRFVGTGGELFGKMLVWFLLTLITAGIYSFWVVPAFNAWIADHTEFDRD